MQCLISVFFSYYLNILLVHTILFQNVRSASKYRAPVKYEHLYLNKNSFSVTGARILQALWVLISNAKCASNGLFSSCHRNGKKIHLEIYVCQRISLLFSIIQMLLAGTSTLTRTLFTFCFQTVIKRFREVGILTDIVQIPRKTIVYVQILYILINV